jgi:hypothetical protein
MVSLSLSAHLKANITDNLMNHARILLARAGDRLGRRIHSALVG